MGHGRVAFWPKSHAHLPAISDARMFTILHSPGSRPVKERAIQALCCFVSFGRPSSQRTLHGSGLGTNTLSYMLAPHRVSGMCAAALRPSSSKRDALVSKSRYAPESTLSQAIGSAYPAADGIHPQSAPRLVDWSRLSLNIINLLQRKHFCFIQDAMRLKHNVWANHVKL